ncbi:hypothetical protein [Methylophaga frappieri]|nr:hypothetical protein [Methylophaga frappieri]
MTAKSLTQNDLVEITGSSLSRVKAITSGRVAKLKFEETQALVKKLHVRGDWLATGEEPMFQSDKEIEFHRRLDQVKESTNAADQLDLDKKQQGRIQTILFALDQDDHRLLDEQLGQILTDDEEQLLEQYRSCSQEEQAAVKMMLAAFRKNQ